MKITYFPNKTIVNKATKADDPLLALFSFEGKRGIVSCIDDAMEHVILLKKVGMKESDIDSYFRLVINRSGADWTFVCPTGYKGIKDRNKRIEEFYSDGHKVIEKGLKSLKYDVPINIPPRFRRHFYELGGK